MRIATRIAMDLGQIAQARAVTFSEIVMSAVNARPTGHGDGDLEAPALAGYWAEDDGADVSVEAAAVGGLA